MCLAVPKKVISQEGDLFTIECPDGAGQKVKSVVNLKIGDYCLTRQNVAVEKISSEKAKEIIEILISYGGKSDERNKNYK